MIAFGFSYVGRKCPLSRYGHSTHLLAHAKAHAKLGMALNTGDHKFLASLGASSEFMATEVSRWQFHTEDPQLNYYTPL